MQLERKVDHSIYESPEQDGWNEKSIGRLRRHLGGACDQTLRGLEVWQSRGESWLAGFGRKEC